MVRGVEGETGEIDDRDGAHQGHRDGQGDDQGGAHRAQEDPHHQGRPAGCPRSGAPWGVDDLEDEDRIIGDHRQGHARRQAGSSSLSMRARMRSVMATVLALAIFTMPRPIVGCR